MGAVENAWNVVLMCSWEDAGYGICSRAPGIAVSPQWMSTNPQQELHIISFCGSPSFTPAALWPQRGSLRTVVEAVGVPFPQTFVFHSENVQVGCGRHVCNLRTLRGWGRHTFKFKVSIGYLWRPLLKINKQINR